MGLLRIHGNAVGWVMRQLPIKSTRFTTFATCAFGARGNDGKPLAEATGGLADSGYCHKVTCGSRRYMPSSGFGRGLAWEEKIGLALGVLARLRIRGLLRGRSGLGHEVCIHDPLRVRNRGIWRALGYRRAPLDGSALETKKRQTLACPLGTRTL